MKVIDSLKEYTGPNDRTNYTSGDDYMKDFEDIMQFVQFDEQTFVKAFGLKLKGPALMWYQNLRASAKASYYNLKAEFALYITREGYQEDYRIQITNAKQERNETCEEFWGRLQALQDKANRAALATAPDMYRLPLHQMKEAIQFLTQEYQRTRKPEILTKLDIVDDDRKKLELTIPDRVSENEIWSIWKSHVHQRLASEIRLELDPRGDQPMKTVLQLAINRERLNREKLGKRRNEDREEEDSPKSKKKPRGDDKKNPKEGDKSKAKEIPKFEGTCNKCGQYGHRAKHCALKRINITGYVRTGDRGIPPDDPIEKLPGATLLSVPGMIAGTNMSSIYLDSGAEVNMLSAKFVMSWKDELKRMCRYRPMKPGTKVELTGIFEKGKCRTVPTGVMVEVPVRLGTPRFLSKVVYTLYFYIVKDIPMDVIIGFPYWDPMISAVDIKRKRVVLNDANPPTYVGYNKEPEASRGTYPKVGPAARLAEPSTGLPEDEEESSDEKEEKEETDEEESKSSSQHPSRDEEDHPSTAPEATSSTSSSTGSGPSRSQSAPAEQEDGGSKDTSSKRKEGRRKIPKRPSTHKKQVRIVGMVRLHLDELTGDSDEETERLQEDESRITHEVESAVEERDCDYVEVKTNHNQEEDNSQGVENADIKQNALVSALICSASVRNSEELPPRTKMLVEIKLSKRGREKMVKGTDYIFNPKRNRAGVHTASSLIHYDGKSPMYTDVVNATEKVQRFHVGTVLGTLTPVHGDVTEWAEQRRLIDMAWTPKPKEEWNFEKEIEKSVKSSVLSPQQILELKDLLREFEDCFAPNPMAPGTTDKVTHSIDTGNATPIKAHPARMSPPEQEVVKKTIDGMMEAGVIRPSRSPWSSRIVLARKKDGSPRFCVDYRRLNDATVKDSYPLPYQQDLMDNLANAKYFSTIDMASGYWQIPLSEDAIQKTAFTSRFGLYEYLVMPYGLTNAPATFQRMMDLVLVGLTWVECLVYMDDIIIFSETWEEHLIRLKNVFERLREHKLVAKIQKCQFGRESIPYLGHIISIRGTATDPEKVKAIQTIPIPKTVSEVRCILGIFGYYRKFIKNYADVAEPLTHLLKKKVVFEWTQACEEALKTLKIMMSEAPVLLRPDFKKAFTLVCDASKVGIGAVLEQTGDDGEQHPVMYWSKTLKPAERNYTTTERECLAIVEAVKNFRHYLYGTRFTVVTDHHALEFMNSAPDLTGRLQRWAMRMAEYNFDIKYRKGKENANADALSRLGHDIEMEEEEVIHPLVAAVRRVTRSQSQEDEDDEKEDSENQFDERVSQLSDGDIWDIISVPAMDKKQLVTRKILLEDQRNDSFSGALYRALILRANPDGANKLSEQDEKELRHEDLRDYKLIDDLVYHIYRTKGLIINQLVIPKHMRREYLVSIHDGLGSGGHLGLNKSYDKMLNRYWWPGMYKEMEEWIKTCEYCQRRKGRRQPAALQPNLITTRPWQCVGIDVLGPLPMTKNRYRYIIVFVDHFTKWVEAFPIRRNDATSCAELLVTQIVCRYGAPERVLTDRGSPFLSTLAYEVYKILNIHKLNTTAYHPQTNGMVERFNSTLVAMLAMYVGSNQKDWDKFIPYCLFAYNTSRHELSHFSPYYLLFGREATLPIDAMCRIDSTPFQSVGEYARHIILRMRRAHRIAERNQREIANKYRVKSLERPPPVYNIGDKVMMQFYHEPFGLTKKLGLMWRGPYTVVKQMGPVTYKIEIPSQSGQSITYKTHVNRLKPFFERSDELHAADMEDDTQLRRELLKEEAEKQHEAEVERDLADRMEEENKEQ